MSLQENSGGGALPRAGSLAAAKDPGIMTTTARA